MVKIDLSERAKIRVGIIFGGRSAEHEISILSARNVLEALDRSRFEPVLIGIDKTGRWLAQDEQRLLALPGIPPTELVSRLIDLAVQRGRRRAAIGRSFFQQ